MKAHFRYFSGSALRNLSLIILLTLIFPSETKGQLLRGKITNRSGEPIPYATVYINELRMGTSSGSNGYYEIKLPPGKNAVVYQCLGYSPLHVDITLDTQTITKDVVLEQQYYQIPEVRITATGEDPAYIIMRKVIGLAPYYLNQVNNYLAQVYIKGNLLINKIPKIFRKSLKIEAKSESASLSTDKASRGNIKEGDSFFMESFNEIEFSAPDKYVQKVISFNSTFPEQGNEISPMGFIQASFYQPILADMAISPLSPDAFAHYRFRYLGSSTQDTFTINKIEVIPKRKSQQLFTGTIYIIEDLWCLHSIDLTNENLAGIIKIRQLYIPVQDNIWLPVSHRFDINISIMGFKADAGYGSSVKYLEVKPNLSLKKPETVPVNYHGGRRVEGTPKDTTLNKSERQIENILSKDALTNRDMVRLSRLMEKASEKSLGDSAGRNPEIIDKTKYIIEKDAASKDSSYWSDIRPIPLSEAEIMSVRVSDSIKSIQTGKSDLKDTLNREHPVQKRSGGLIKNIASGHTWSDTSGLSITYGGLADFKKLSFNTVDGFIHGFDLKMTKMWAENQKMIISPDIRWAFTREKILWKINLSYMYDMMKQSLITVKAGRTDRDFSEEGGINTFLNTATSLFLKKNYLKLYESRYLEIGWRSELINGLYIDLSGKTEDRKILENSTGFSLFDSKRAYSPNIPVNRYHGGEPGPSPLLYDQRHAEFVTEFEFTPGQRYRIRGKTKIPAGSDYPTFRVLWKHGMNESADIPAKYRHFDFFSIRAGKTKETGAYREYRWRIRAGGFLNNTSLPFYDFSHFNSQPFPLLIDNFEDAFMIPSFYSMSTPEWFSEGHFKFTTPYLLLKLLPGLSNTLIRENITLSHLSSLKSRSYSEAGYSLSEVFFLGEIGIYAGFDNFRFRSLGAKFILKFN